MTTPTLGRWQWPKISDTATSLPELIRALNSRLTQFVMWMTTGPYYGLDTGETAALVVNYRYPPLNVKRYGAKGDGSDATVAFQSLFTVLTARGGGKGFVPAGSYGHILTLTPPANVELEGEGVASLITSATIGVIGLHLNAVSNVHIRRLKITSTTAATADRGDGVRATDATDCTIEDVETSGCMIGIRLTGTGLTARVHLIRPHTHHSIESGILENKCFDCTSFSPTTHHNGTTSLHHGFYMSDASSRRIRLIDILTYNNGGSGIQVGGQEHEIFGGESSFNGTNGLVNSLGSNFLVNGLFCLDNTNRGVYLDTADSVRLVGVECRRNGKEGAVVKNCKFVKLEGGAYSENAWDGVLLDGSVAGESVRECQLIGITAIDNDSGDTTTYDGVRFAAGGTNARNSVIGGVFRSSTGTTKQRNGITVGAGCSGILLIAPQTFGNKVVGISDLGDKTTLLLPNAETYSFHSANVTIDSSHNWLRCDAGGGSFTVTLPAASRYEGRSFRVSRIDANSAALVTIARAGADTINGQTSYVLRRQYEAVLLTSVSSAWYATAISLPRDTVVTVTHATPTYTVGGTEETVLVDTSGGAVQVSLPFVAGSASRVITVKKIDASANNLTIDAQGTETIDGALSVVTNVQWKSYRLQCDGTAWYVVAGF